jgi:hypothetical protein
MLDVCLHIVRENRYPLFARYSWVNRVKETGSTLQLFLIEKFYCIGRGRSA